MVRQLDDGMELKHFLGAVDEHQVLSSRVRRDAWNGRNPDWSPVTEDHTRQRYDIWYNRVGVFVVCTGSVFGCLIMEPCMVEYYLWDSGRRANIMGFST